MPLKTDYKNDVLDTSKNTKRKYQMTENSDGTFSFDDVTVYSQEGSLLGANDVNAITTRVNQMTASDGLDFRFATDGEGNYGYLGADDSFNPFKKGLENAPIQKVSCSYNKWGISGNSGTNFSGTVLLADAYSTMNKSSAHSHGGPTENATFTYYNKDGVQIKQESYTGAGSKDYTIPEGTHYMTYSGTIGNTGSNRYTGSITLTFYPKEN